MKNIKLNKSEKTVLNVIDGKLHYSVLYSKTDNFKTLKRFDKAVDSLKEKGFIVKGQDNILKRKTLKKMKNLTVKNGLVNTTTNQLLNNYEYLFFQECDLAYNILQEAGAEMKIEEFEKEAWTDIMLDNSDPNNRKFYAVYGEGPVTSDSDCIYIEVEPDESILEQVISILPEY